MKSVPTIDEKYMWQALELARLGLGKTSPNPMVGAVIVKGERVIGRGYHHVIGGDHAEVDAIKHATEDVTGSTMYVTLEPCTHHGKTPPCVEAIVSHKFQRVVMGMPDPDERVSGRSIEILEKAGIETRVGVLEEECRALNETYIRHRNTGLPFVTVKFAQSLDGRIATSTGDSRWISSPASRKKAHLMRARHDAILVGVGTVLIDNPELTVRLTRGRNPKRIVLDSKLRVPLDANVLADQESAPTIVVTTTAADKAKAAALAEKGIEVLTVPAGGNGGIDLPALLKRLGERDITSLMVEGGARIITSFLRQGLADRLVVFIAPRLIGRGTAAIGDLNITEISKAARLTFGKTCRSGIDLVIEARVETTGYGKV
ncbi:MAG: bifunctional diaminohydroxyphosphoribosylaminopyrimidine deaminase/5-amino-6-(5-phosphoribosylamino)uracil reductase RibD [Dehalococcoidales bacterium]|nr:bifunctional diaminohydroxyphosphoribosylaminopyrimidine deaminase/5-amino-6-(5-phosphoribosylamino)uracil reductase RibD [Dehalococcoidales bacterium]